MIAIDLGSNTLRCISYDCQTKEWGEEYETVVRTADGLHVNKIINEKAINRVITALLEADKTLDFSSHEVVAFTTEAMRQAENSAEVLEEIFAKTGVLFKIIDGEREAALTTKAVKGRLDILNFSSSSFTLVDIGGGSTEIIFYKNGNLTSKSFNIGIVTLSESSDDIYVIRKNLDKLLIPVKEYISSYYATYQKPEIFVQTAGTPTTIAAYLQNMNYHTYDASRINGYMLDPRGCQKTMDDLLGMDEQTRAFYVGVGREELIISGIIIVQKLYELLGYTSSVVIDDGLREGIALSYCEKSDK
jgi:exopolyphosphatase/guanosine-5'-triphosphate,3'-diphosphate pyrophosphatase